MTVDPFMFIAGLAEANWYGKIKMRAGNGSLLCHKNEIKGARGRCAFYGPMSTFKFVNRSRSWENLFHI